MRTPFNRSVTDILVEDWERRSAELRNATGHGHGGPRPGAGAKPMDPEVVALVLERRECGETQWDIAQALGISIHAVSRILRKAREAKS